MIEKIFESALDTAAQGGDPDAAESISIDISPDLIKDTVNFQPANVRII